MADCKLERLAIIIDTGNADFVQPLGNGPRETVNVGQLANAIRAVADRIERVHEYSPYTKVMTWCGGQKDSGATVEALQEIEVVLDKNGNQVGIVRWQHEDTPWQWVLTDRPRRPEEQAAQQARAQVVTPRLQVSVEDVQEISPGLHRHRDGFTWQDAADMVAAINGRVAYFVDTLGLSVDYDRPVPDGRYEMKVRFASGQERTYNDPKVVVEDCEGVFMDFDAEVDM